MPETPRFLCVEAVKEDCITISWKPPANDGGSQITNYIVEKLDLKNSDKAPIEVVWTRCAITRKTNFNDETLNPVCKYQYRIIAENMLGPSTPCEPTAVITTLGN